MEYPHLFSPLELRGTTIPNRVVLAPMGTRFNNHDGSVSERYVNYMRARARGGAGLLLTENTHLVHEYTQSSSMGAYHDRLIASLNRLPHAVHAFGARIILQTSIHGGTTQERVIGQQPVAPSAIECRLYPQVPRELTLPEIETLVDAYVQGAYRAWRAGFDGVEVHGAHGYLITQFISPHTNRRTDRYGGDFEGRMRFPTEIVRAIRDLCDDSFIIGFKYNGYENLPGGVDLPLACRIGRYMEGLGVDYLHVASLGANMRPDEDPAYPAVPSLYTREPNPLLVLAETVKAEVAVPVIAAGGFNRPEDAEAALARGAADLVAVGRAFLADPDWASRARRGETDGIRPCIKCNQCHVTMQKANATRCAVNPTLGEPDERCLGRADSPRHIAVVGSGPGGMEAAVTAAARGHRVTLCEKQSEIGGNLRIGSIPFFKEDVRRYYEYSRTRLADSPVEVVLDREADVEYLRSLSPDVVIVAAGSEMVRLELPGGDRALPVTQALLDTSSLGERVTILGAGFVGCEVGWHLAEQGRQVQLIDVLREDQLLADEHSVNRATLLYQLRQAEVPLQCEATPTRITDRGILVTLSDGAEKELAADSVISCVGFRPRRQLYQDLLVLAAPWEVYAVGDCVHVENYYHAVQSAFQLARHL